MPRFVDWERRLAAYLDTVRYAEFRYGENDCALHVANAVLAMTGEDFGARFRGRYRSIAGSVRALKLYGAGDLPSTLTAALGAPINPRLAQAGDVVMRAGAAGICMGAIAYFVGEEGGRAGLVTVPMREWEAAWRVPYV